MLAVIADDITGAAEIAGIGLRMGMRVAMVTGSNAVVPLCDLLVYATDTRSLSEQEAVEITCSVAREIASAGYTTIFKKTDSVLRGHVSAELNALMETVRKPRALYLPANPSKDRIIRDGIYYVGGEPIDRTVFARDPEFPANTSLVQERIPAIKAVVNSGDPLPESGIVIGNMENRKQIEEYVSKVDGSTVLAGGADLFSVYLCALGYTEREDFSFEGVDDRRVLVVLGSTAGQSLSEQPYFQRHDVCSCAMPEEVFLGKVTAENWIESLKTDYNQTGSVILSIGHPSHGGKDFAVRLRGIMAEAVAGLVEKYLPEELVIEGGATAFAVLDRLGWNSFRIIGESAPGVVRMALVSDPSVRITLKPGSYPWGEALFS